MNENAACPRCGVAFRCGARDAVCACAALVLDDALRTVLQQTLQGCLCMGCLVALNASPTLTLAQRESE